MRLALLDSPIRPPATVFPEQSCHSWGDPLATAKSRGNVPVPFVHTAEEPRPPPPEAMVMPLLGSGSPSSSLPPCSSRYYVVILLASSTSKPALRVPTNYGFLFCNVLDPLRLDQGVIAVGGDWKVRFWDGNVCLGGPDVRFRLHLANET